MNERATLTKRALATYTVSGTSNPKLSKQKCRFFFGNGIFFVLAHDLCLADLRLIFLKIQLTLSKKDTFIRDRHQVGLF